MLLFILQLQKYSKIETMSSKTSALHKSPIESHSLPNVLGYWIHLENAYVTTITSGSAMAIGFLLVSVVFICLCACWWLFNGCHYFFVLRTLRDSSLCRYNAHTGISPPCLDTQLVMVKYILERIHQCFIHVSSIYGKVLHSKIIMRWPG